MVNKSFKQNSLIKYTSILLLNLILVLIMGVTNIFGDLSEQDKKTRVSKAVEAAKQERTTQDVSDKEVTDDQLIAAAQLQVDKTDDAQKTQDKVTEAAKNFVENYKNARDQIIKKAVEEAQTERTTQKLSIAEISDDVLNTEAKKQAKHDDPNKRTQEEVTAAAKKFVSDTKDNKIKDAIKAAQQVILDDTDKIVTLLVAQLGKESFYNAYKEAATQQANHDKADEREKTKVNAAAIKVANKQLNDAKTARDKKVQTALKNAKIVSLQKNCEYEEDINNLFL
ncbi:hypothetical protein CPX_001658 [Candidatus Phytoplasma pruni]|uniref:Uncharacterized protein n=1 Tax=Candidatus Phytoplasma pruni TaxID=479893 RepID=A0A0M1MZP4_9MOLU|nr:hypothetical protein [Candidatus Phytoplasma pruni]KOR75362.1 hypothetical protein CPX_001658 [Candidatus Phytoplasma pruni]